MKVFVINQEKKEAKIDDDYSFSNKEIWTEKKLKKFKEWLVEENVEPKNDSSNKKLWFLILIPIVPIVIFLFIYFIKKNSIRKISNINKNNEIEKFNDDYYEKYHKR